MKKAFLAIALLTATATPTLANPDVCRTIRGGEYACMFYPTVDNGALYLFPNTIQPGFGGAVDFVYLSRRGSGRYVKQYAQVNCNGSRRYWHVFLDEVNARTVEVSSDASKRMLNYVCQAPAVSERY